MKLTKDEHRALAFITALLCLSAAVRLLGLPEPVAVPESAALDLAGHIEAVEGAVAEAEARARPLAEGEVIDPNTATTVELDRLPGVGPALADRIVADREAHGRFRTLGDLQRVAGIGARTAERLEPHVGLRSGPATNVGPRRTPTSPGPQVREGATNAGSIAVNAAGAANARHAAPIDVNAADAQMLARLPGIGPVLAARIVAYRDSAGPFRTLSELEAVKGIGPATIVRIADRVLIK